MIDTTSLWVYLGVFCALVAAGFGAPIPEELPIVTAGALVGHAAEDPDALEKHPQPLAVLAVAPAAPFPATLPWGGLVEAQKEIPIPPKRSALRWWIMLPVCILGVVISDALLYTIGRLGGARLLENRWVARLLKPEKREQIQENFRRYGVWVLLFARVLPGIRSPIFITAGIMKLSLARFLLADGIYAIPGVSLLFFLAFWFGDQFRDLIETAERGVQRVRPLIILLAIAVVAGFLLQRFLKRPVVTGDPEELPIIGHPLADKVEHSGETLPPHAIPAPDTMKQPGPPDRIPEGAD